MDQKKIGLFLKELRNEKGLTQGQLAEHLAVSNRSVSRWETGSNLLDISLIVELAEFYEVEINEIINGERKSENMNDESMKTEEKETLKRVVEYVDNEKKSQLQTFAILTEILIVIGLVISITLGRVVADTMTERVVILICGWFVWGYGLLLRVKVRREISELEEK